MGKWVIGTLSGGVAVSTLIIGLYDAKGNMPVPLFNFLLVFLVVCLVVLFLILIFSVVRFLLEWNRSLEFGTKWYCHHNGQAKRIELSGNVDLHSSSFSKLRGDITQNGITYRLSPQPIVRTLTMRDRFALSFVGENISISTAEPVYIQVTVWLGNLRSKTFTTVLLVIPVGGE